LDFSGEITFYKNADFGSIFAPCMGKEFSGTENILRNAKYNLPCSDEHKIPLGRDWLKALLIFGLIEWTFTVLYCLIICMI